MRKAKQTKVRLRSAPQPTNGLWHEYMEEALNRGRPKTAGDLQARALTKHEIQQQYTEEYVERLRTQANHHHGQTL